MKKIKRSNDNFTKKFFPAFKQLLSLKPNEGHGRLKNAIKRSYANIEKVSNEIGQERQDMFESMCKIDDGGNAMIDDKNQYQFETTQKKKEALKKEKNIMTKKSEFEVIPVNEKDFEGVPFYNVGMEIALGDFVITEKYVDPDGELDTDNESETDNEPDPEIVKSGNGSVV